MFERGRFPRSPEKGQDCFLPSAYKEWGFPVHWGAGAELLVPYLRQRGGCFLYIMSKVGG